MRDAGSEMLDVGPHPVRIPHPASRIPARIHQRQCILNDRHHSEAEQIDLDQAHVGAVVLVPLDHHPPRHACVLERNDIVEPALAEDHAAGMLAEMARQVLDLLPEPAERLDDGSAEVDTDLLQVALERFLRIDPLEVVHHLREAIDLVGRHRQDLADFTRRALAAIRDHIGGHRGAQRAVLLVHVLDHALAAVAARKVQVDVGPLATLLREEPLEQQLHPDRIDGRDAEAVANGAVGRRPAPLDEDVVLPAEIDDVPDDEEVAGEIELLDEVQLALDLPPRAIVVRPIPFACARLRDLPQERRHRLAARHGVIGKAIAEVRHRVLEPVGQLARPGDRFGDVGEQACHRVGRLEIALGIAREPPAGPLERRLVTDAGQHVVERTAGRVGEADTVGCDHRHVERGGQVAQRSVVGFFLAQQVPLQLDPRVRGAEDPDDAVDEAADAELPSIERGAADERDEPANLAVEFLERERPLPFRGSELHPRHQPREIAIALA